jgi:hypothetical protein
LGAARRNRGARVEENTPTHFVSDESGTNRISWDTDEPTLRRAGPDAPEEPNPGDDLGLDRPIFPPPTGLDTRVDIDLALVAATAVPEAPPVPLDDVTSEAQPPAGLVHEVVFDVGPDELTPAPGSQPLPDSLAAPARRAATRRFSSAPYPPVRIATVRRRSPLWVVIPVAAMIGAGGVTAILVALEPTAATPTSSASALAQRPEQLHRARPRAKPQPRIAQPPRLGVDQLLSRARASLERQDYPAARADYERLSRDPRISEPRLNVEVALGLSELALKLNDRRSALRHARDALLAAEETPSPELRARAMRQLERCDQ